MPASCRANTFCTYRFVPHVGLELIQEFGCQTRVGHAAVDGSSIFQMVNLCAWRVLYYNPSQHCINPDTTQGGLGRFGNVTSFYVSPFMSC
jgi:hypothetical protein